MATTQTRKFEMSAQVYSPRWGRADTYIIVFDPERIHIDNSNGKTATCTFPDVADPEWTGHNSGIGNPLMMVFSNDSIYAPRVVPMALESAWKRWHGGESTDEEVRAGVAELFAWIDQTARSKPSSDFWVGVF